MVKAVDIVLLLPKELHDKVVKFNRELKAKDVEQIELDGESVPHLSLGMACMEEDDIPEFFEKISVDFSGLELASKDISTRIRPSKKDPVCQLRFEDSENLKSLHEKVMVELKSIEQKEPRAEMFQGQEKTSERTVVYVKEFAEKHSFENYEPHVTLGFGDPQGYIEPNKYHFTRLAICHLGNHNTCREILREKRV